VKAQPQAYVAAWRLRASDLRATEPVRADIYEVCAAELEDALSPAAPDDGKQAPDDGKGQPEQTPELWAVKYHGEYLPYTWTNEAGARHEVRRSGGYVIPLYRKPVVQIPQAAPQGWQQGAAELIADWREDNPAVKAEGGYTETDAAYSICADRLEALLKRHQERK
jgi:hypothetical protein